jgi:diguanylate cyclase (GGDEF)-like protein/PAS domain S-box-containing protein
VRANVDIRGTPPPPALDLVARVPDPALVIGATGIVRSENDLARDLLGGRTIGTPVSRLLVLPDATAVAPGVEMRDQPATAVRLDGTPVPVRVSVGPASDDAAIATLRAECDEVLLERTRPLLDLAFELAPIGMAFFDTHGRYLRVNPALADILGRPADDLIGRRDQEFTHPHDRESDVAAAGRILAGEISSWQTEKRFLRPDGSVVWVVANLSFLRDEAGRPLSWLGQFQDVTTRMRLESRLRRLAEEDPLTGLPNRRRLDRELEIARRLGAQAGMDGALIVIDLDGLKAINDACGHAAGDDAIRAVGAALRNVVRRTDTVARTGGDEFAVVLPLTDANAARRVAGALGAAVSELSVAGRSLSASIGTTTFSGSNAAPSDVLLAEADAAMYRAKRTSPPREG